MNNTQGFLNDLNILNKAAVGVMFVRTREPYRALSALRDYAAAIETDFRAWTPLRGWGEFGEDAVVPKKNDPATVDLLPALRDLENKEKGLHVMIYPHTGIADGGRVRILPAVQLLKEFSITFARKRTRVILVVPGEFEMPAELADDVMLLDFAPPSASELLVFLDSVLQSIQDEKQRPPLSAEDQRRLVTIGAGMTANEFRVAISRALVTHRTELPNVGVDKFAAVLAQAKTEIVRRSQVLELMDSDSMENVGGLEALKAYIADRAGCFGEEARAAGVDQPKGVALIGPPGTGKSLAARCIASALGIPLLRLDVGRVFNSLVGSSEARLREALRMVEAVAPVVLFIDEADKALDQNSSGGDSGVGKRVLGTLLSWMQDNKAPVYMVVTANDVRGLPPEFLRKGRLDEVFSVTVPSAEERRQILAIHLRKRGRDAASIADLEVAVARSEGYVPSEIEAAVKEAVVVAYTHKLTLDGQLIAGQFDHMKPLRLAFREKFEAMQHWAEQNARPASRTTDAPAPAPAAGGPAAGLDLAA